MFFHPKFNANIIITLRLVAFQFRVGFCQSKSGFYRKKIFSQLKRCAIFLKIDTWGYQLARLFFAFFTNEKVFFFSAWTISVNEDDLWRKLDDFIFFPWLCWWELLDIYDGKRWEVKTEKKLRNVRTKTIYRPRKKI